MTVTHSPPDADVATSIEPTDAKVIGRSGDEPECFSMIFDRYFDQIHRYAASRLGIGGADDIAADTFLVAFAQRARYDRSRPRARAWLYGIATNLIRRHRRTEVRMYSALARAGAAGDDDGLADRVADRVSAQRLRPELAAGLKKLPAADRDVLLLVAYGQLSYDEVAIALTIPSGTVGSRLNRARRQLREALGPATTGDQR